MSIGLMTEAPDLALSSAHIQGACLDRKAELGLGLGFGG